MRVVMSHFRVNGRLSRIVPTIPVAGQITHKPIVPQVAFRTNGETDDEWLRK